jgi:hypothetical protein
VPWEQSQAPLLLKLEADRADWEGVVYGAIGRNYSGIGCHDGGLAEPNIIGIYAVLSWCPSCYGEAT